MILVFGMPYIMDNSTVHPGSPTWHLLISPLVDDEMKAEFESRQKGSAVTGPGAANSLQNFDAAAWLAGSSTPKRSETPVEKGITR